jgi:hypothetical protein
LSPEPNSVEHDSHEGNLYCRPRSVPRSDRIVAIPEVAGLHHRYDRIAA